MCFCALVDFDIFLAVFFKLADYGAVDENNIAVRIVATDLALVLMQEAIVANPVGDVMRQPAVAFWTVIIRARCADFQREFFVPVHALGAVRNAEAVRDAGGWLALGSDSHIAYSLGMFEHCERIITGVNFPQDRILNVSPRRLLNYLEQRGRPVITELADL